MCSPVSTPFRFLHQGLLLYSSILLSDKDCSTTSSLLYQGFSPNLIIIDFSSLSHKGFLLTVSPSRLTRHSAANTLIVNCHLRTKNMFSRELHSNVNLLEASFLISEISSVTDSIPQLPPPHSLHTFATQNSFPPFCCSFRY